MCRKSASTKVLSLDERRFSVDTKSFTYLARNDMLKKITEKKKREVIIDILGSHDTKSKYTAQINSVVVSNKMRPSNGVKRLKRGKKKNKNRFLQTSLSNVNSAQYQSCTLIAFATTKYPRRCKASIISLACCFPLPRTTAGGTAPSFAPI